MAIPFTYVEGDWHKTPVDASAQKPGTTLVFVDAAGKDFHFTVGRTIVNDPATIKTQFDRGNSGHAHEG